MDVHLEHPPVDESALMPNPSLKKIRQDFALKHRAARQRWNIGENFPDPAVVESYRRPEVGETEGSLDDCAVAIIRSHFGGSGWAAWCLIIRGSCLFQAGPVALKV